ncbi:MAG: alanyl-tRNA editing protein AlaXM [Chloroflexota bacterium]
METKLLYLRDSYLKEFDARVLDVIDHNVVLDRTVFYPRGGGQMADRGTLQLRGTMYPVIAVERRGDAVMHTVDGALPPIGARVTGTVDWEHRYTMMRTHTALHVLCGVIYNEFSSHVTGCQMYPDRARMDFTLADLSPDTVRHIEQVANDAIGAGYPVRVDFMPRSQADVTPELIRTKVNLIPEHVDPIRTVEIVGLDLQADGGTHVNNTLEIGSIKITKTENKGRENRRLEIQLLQPVIARG